MSYFDDYLDVKHILKKNKGYARQFERFAEWAFRLESACESMEQEVASCHNTIKTMMGVAYPTVTIAYKL